MRELIFKKKLPSNIVKFYEICHLDILPIVAFFGYEIKRRCLIILREFLIVFLVVFLIVFLVIITTFTATNFRDND